MNKNNHTKQFIKIFRPLNVLSIVMLMIGIRVFHYNNILIEYNFAKNNIQFSILIMLIGLITANGYLINDIIDVNTDKINRPNKNISISSKYLIILYIIISIITVIATTFLIYSFYVKLIMYITMLLLYLYSVFFQKLPLIGNVIIAILSALLPILYYCFEYNSKLQSMLMFYSCIGFGITLLREIIKDIEDIKGDKQTGYKTFPVTYGVKKSKTLYYMLSTLFILVIITIDNIFIKQNIIYYIPSITLFVLSIYFVYKEQFYKTNIILKSTLFYGVIILFLI